MNKRDLSERDICTKCITPAVVKRRLGYPVWQIREDVGFTKGRIIVRGKLVRAAKLSAQITFSTTSRTFPSL